MRKYRIAPDSYASGMWAIQIWRPWWPFWVEIQPGLIPTKERAREALELMSVEFVEKR